MQQQFYELADHATGRAADGEVLLAGFSGEESDFVRFNRSAVRQAGSVCQRYITLELIRGSRHVKAVCAVSGDAAADRQRLDESLGDLRRRLGDVPEDPYLLYATEQRNTAQQGENRLGDSDLVLEAVLAAGENRDLVGIFTQGGIFSGFANSLGQRNWFEAYTFHLDWCFYHQADKAVKSSYAGFEWSNEVFERKVASAAEQLDILSRPAKTIEPSECRVYLAPAAMDELVGLLSWCGFGLKDHRTKSTCLLKMIEQDARLNESVTIRENTHEGMAPNFQSAGFIKPDQVALIERGRYRHCLVNPRSAKEYGVQTNAASPSEAPQSLDMDAGEVPDGEVLQRLGTGVYVNRLWYLNYSDVPACRITGMTRFATFWVEGGRIAAPLNVMRFDETIYRALGENLIALTREREFIPSSSTYGGRSTGSARVPGALIDRFRFTL